MPQIVLQVPPEVTRVLSAILGCLQRLEQEVREARLRLGYPMVHRADGPNSNATATVPATPRPLAKHCVCGDRQRDHDNLRGRCWVCGTSRGEGCQKFRRPETRPDVAPPSL